MLLKSLLPLLVACSKPDPSLPAPKAATTTPAVAAPAVAAKLDHAAEIRRASAKYLEWTRVDEKPNIAPTL